MREEVSQTSSKRRLNGNGSALEALGLIPPDKKILFPWRVHATCIVLSERDAPQKISPPGEHVPGAHHMERFSLPQREQ